MKEYKLNQIAHKRILGRNAYKNDDESLTLFWGGAALEVNIKAREIWACISTTYDNLEHWLAVEVNGAPVSRFMLNKEKTWYCLARNMNPEKENLITIIKDTQPMNDDSTHSLVIHALGLDEAGEFVLVKPRSCSIEFIGDSLTAGEGTLLSGKTRCRASPMTSRRSRAGRRPRWRRWSPTSGTMGSESATRRTDAPQGYCRARAGLTL